MAKMYPSEINSDRPFSEQRVFHDLKLGLPAEWHVIYSAAFFKDDVKKGAHEGELDFLLIHPKFGIMGLEVKGGQKIKREEDGTFYTQPSRSQPGDWKKIRDPGNQVQNGIHSIRRYIQKKSGNPRLKELRALWGVVFPSYEITNDAGFGPGLPRSVIIDATELSNPTKAILKIIKYRTGENSLDLAFSDQDITDLLDILMPKFELVRITSKTRMLTGEIQNRMIEAEQKIIQLTQEQVRAFDLVSSHTRISVKGCAGTGKTIVGLELARRFAKEGKKVLFLCYNRLLADYYRDNVEGVHVNNFHLFCYEEGKKRGMTFPSPRSKDKQKFFDVDFADRLLFLVEEDPSLRWDAIIVDEGQDFQESWWIPIEEMLANEDSKLWVLFDPNQNLYDGSNLKELNLFEIELTNNVRNTKQIAEAAYGCIGINPQFARQSPPEGVDVQWELMAGHKDQSQSQTISKVGSILHRLVNDEMLDPKNIVVLSWMGKRSPVWKRKRLGNFELIDTRQPINQQQIRFDSIPRFKGLEADAIIICDVPSDLKEEDKNELYVGTSRAKHVLAVIQYDT